MSYVLSTCFLPSGSFHPAAYAALVAEQLGCPLKVVQAYSVPFVVGEFPVTVIAPDEQRLIANQQLETAELQLRADHPGLILTTALGYGTLAEVLEDAIDAAAPLLVVIGNDESEESDAPIGTATLETMASITVPVLVVPPERETPALKHLCLALTSQSLESSARLEGLDALAAALKFRITVVTVSEPGTETRQDEQSPVRTQLAALNASFETLPAAGDHLDNTLLDYATGIGADCLAVLKTERGFFNALFHKSQMKSLLKSAHFPIMSLHAAHAAS